MKKKHFLDNLFYFINPLKTRLIVKAQNLRKLIGYPNPNPN